MMRNRGLWMLVGLVVAGPWTWGCGATEEEAAALSPVAPARQEAAATTSQTTVQHVMSSGGLGYTAPSGCRITGFTGSGTWNRWSYDGNGTYWQGCNDLSGGVSNCSSPMSGLNAAGTAISCNYDSPYSDNRGTCTYSVTLECEAACPPEAPHRWPSNGRCYKCPEGQIWMDNGQGSASCRPRCEGLSGAALQACNDCSIDGGVACRCDQLTGAAKQQCFCSAFGGGQACFSCAASAPYKWSDGSCHTCPQATPHSWANGSCNACPQEAPNKWANGSCQVCPEATPHRWANGSCNVCPTPERPTKQADGTCTCSSAFDKDQDGVCDDADNCINTANANQADADADGRGDACDTCDTPMPQPPGGVTRLSTTYVTQVNPRPGQPSPLAGDTVTVEAYLNACNDPDAEALRLRQFSTATTQAITTPSDERKLFSFKAGVKDERYQGWLVNTSGSVLGWARIKSVCPADLTPPTGCPDSPSDACGLGDIGSFREEMFAYKHALAEQVAINRPDIVPDLLQAINLRGWITNDTMSQPPSHLPAPVGQDTTAVEAALETALAAPGAGPLDSVGVWRAAMNAAGCNPDTRCTQTQYLQAIIAGHNVLKNAANSVRNANPSCGAHGSAAWVTTGIGDTPEKRLCEYFSAVGTPQWQRDALRKLPTSRKILANLAPLRPYCFDNGNVLGPHYHLFAMAVIDYYTNSTATTAAAMVEFAAQVAVQHKYDWPYLETNLAQANAFVEAQVLRAMGQ